MPPEHLRVRVGASRREEVFTFMGESIAHTVAHLAGLESTDADPRRRRILDFGCGCGRVMRYLAPRFPHLAWHGADVDGEAIAWCGDHLGELAVWHRIDQLPPLPLPDGSLDVVYAVSVFTHVPEHIQRAWLEELDRILSDDGLLIVSVYSEFIHAVLPDDLGRKLADKGILYGNDGGTAGLPASYQSCFHTRAYIVDTWSKRFRIDAYVERAFFFSQDAVLMRKPAS